MIQDLKADSARWDAERRAATRGQPGSAGGTKLSGNPNASFVRRSNSPTAMPRQYHNSEIHQQRQYYGPTSATDPASAYGDPMAVDPPALYSQPPMRYPGTGNHGYNGVNSAYSAHQTAAQQQRYEQPSTSYSNHVATPYAPPQQQSYSPGPPGDVPMYGAGMTAGPGMAPPPVPAFGQSPNAQEQYVRGSAFQSQPSMVSSSAGPSRNMYQTAGPGYAPPAEYSYAQSGGMPMNSTAAYTQPQDILYGRGSSSQQSNTIPAPSDYLASPAGNQPQAQTGHNTAVSGGQYKEAPTAGQNSAPTPSRNSVGPPSGPQVYVSGPSGTNASTATSNAPRRDREHDRHRADRDTDRHAAERNAHRHRTRN